MFETSTDAIAVIQLPVPIKTFPYQTQKAQIEKISKKKLQSLLDLSRRKPYELA